MSWKELVLALTWKSYSIWSAESLQWAAAFSWPSVGAHPPVEQMYIATGFVTLVHSYIQVTARSIDYILFVRALGVSMWKQLVKVLQLKYPTISYTNKLYEGNKKTLLTQTLHHKMLKLLHKIKNFFCLRQGTNLASLVQLLPSYFVTIIWMLEEVNIYDLQGNIP